MSFCFLDSLLSMYRPPCTTGKRTSEIPCLYDTIYDIERQEHAFEYFVYNYVENMWISPVLLSKHGDSGILMETYIIVQDPGHFLQIGFIKVLKAHFEPLGYSFQSVHCRGIGSGHDIMYSRF